MTDIPGGTDAGRSKLWMRLLHMVLISLLIGAAIAVMHVMTVVQFIIMLVDKGAPNPQIAAFGKSLGAWIAKAIRFQTAESDDKPWPWSPLE